MISGVFSKLNMYLRVNLIKPNYKTLFFLYFLDNDI